jgi:hypothetical protein
MAPGEVIAADIDSIPIWKDSPTRHTIPGAFLHRFWSHEKAYNSHMVVGSVFDEQSWLSCDHTFKSIANIGVLRDADRKWVKQYSGLFCVLNQDGEVLTWKLTKSLKFASVEEQLICLQQRLLKQGKCVHEFYIDNCCVWRKKLQQIFGSTLKVLLDLFHAVQRITIKMSKRHPLNSHCVNDLRLVFRDPTDSGHDRMKATPDTSPKFMFLSGSLWNAMELKFYHQLLFKKSSAF